MQNLSKRRKRNRPPSPIRRVRRDVLLSARKATLDDLLAFDKLSSLLPVHPVSTRIKLRDILKRPRTAQAYNRMLGLPLLLLYYLVLLVVGTFMESYFLRDHSILHRPFLCGVGILYFFLALIAVTDTTEGKRILSSAMLLMTVGCPVVSVAAWSWWLSSKQDLAEGLAAATLGGTVMVWGLMTGSVFMTFVRDLTRVLASCGPDALAVARCLDLLTKLDSEDYRWNDLLWRRRITTRIESIAKTIERCGVWMRRVGDGDSAMWAQNNMARIAAGIREKKKWLVLPMPDTPQQLKASMATLFLALVNCDWHSLPQQESAQLSHRDLILVGSRRLVGVLVSVTIPAGLYWIVQRSSIALTSPVRDYVVGVLLLWVLVVILSAADPLYQSRVDAFRTMVQIFPFGKKDKEK